MTVNWNGAAVLAKVRAGAVLGLQRGVEAVRDEAVSLILSGPKTGRIYRRGGVSHQASAPGEPPASDTGQLVNSIITSVDTGKLTGSVGFGTEYAKFLNYGTRNIAPRPFAIPALVNKKEEIEQDIADEIAKALR